MVNILMSRSGALNSSWAFENVSEILKKEMKVAVLGFSFFNSLTEDEYTLMYNKDSEYNLKIDEMFLDFGITDVKWIYYFNMSKEEMIKIIEEADILYLPGGAPDLMMERIIEKDILSEISSFNKIVIGSSAGAMIQLSNYHISPDNEYFKFSEHEGLGFIDSIFIEVHYAKRKKQKSSMRKMRKKYLKPIYTIPDNGMVIIENEKITTLNEASRFYNKRGINKQWQKTKIKK